MRSLNKLTLITWAMAILASIPFIILFVKFGVVASALPLVTSHHAIIPLLAIGASAGLGILQGVQQRRQARQLEAQNVRPIYTPNANIVKNQAIAEQMSQVGLPDQVYNNQLNQLQQNLTTGLRTIGQRGNLSTNVNAIVANSNRAIQNLNAQDAQARMQWTQNLMNANTALANEQRQAFNINQLQPYQQTRADVASLRRAGTQNIFGSLGMLGQGAMMGIFNSNGTNPLTPNTQGNFNTNPLFLQPQTLGGGMYA